MQDRPDLAELLDSVRLFLEDEVLPAVSDARLKFRARVAAYVLAVAARERRQEGPLLEAEWRRLAAILGPLDSAPTDSSESPQARVASRNELLARAIRSGAIDASPGTPVWDHLRLAAFEKVQIANPAKLRTK